MEKLYYSIGEVAGLLDENVSAIRFWSNTFTQFVKPVRTAKGNRQFTAADLEVFKKIKHLLKVDSLTIEGAIKVLEGDTAKVDNSVKVLESLKQIRGQLVEIKKSL
ncbi:MAG: MerR family transcriptional regulator [Bacteroidales bacterium]|nr:MerR family transcriptional regulator [Bacteroidales bacterium]